MFQRFTSALFGADTSDLRPDGAQSEEEEEDWILVNYLTDACSGSSVCADEEDLVILPSPTAPPMVRCPSLTSLNSTMTEPDELDAAAPDPDRDSDLDSDFLRLEPGSLEESWFVTPPACFTRAQPLPLEPSPLENLLIEHPSMSVYLVLNALLSVSLRPECIQRRPVSSSLPPSVSGRVDPLQPRPPHSLSKNTLRRLNPQRPPKTAAPQLHQPTHRQFNF
uniref:Uncharacterized protein n=1 Tax=Periophthalmus magnuspinnatus TaxID=409849 RepID=A0A3B3ZU16_9GOBI